MRVIFLDIDGVLVNRWSLSNHSGIYAKAHPDCVAALNYIVEETGACIVVSSTWRHAGVSKMRDFLSEWGVKAKVLGCTPDLSRKEGRLFIGTVRGDEIQAWLDGLSGHFGPVESFVILDDDNDMRHLKDRLVRTEFVCGLTMLDAEKAVALLTDDLAVRCA